MEKYCTRSSSKKKKVSGWVCPLTQGLILDITEVMMGLPFLEKGLELTFWKTGSMLIKFLIIQLSLFILLVVVVGFKYKENQG